MKIRIWIQLPYDDPIEVWTGTPEDEEDLRRRVVAALPDPALFDEFHDVRGDGSRLELASESNVLVVSREIPVKRVDALPGDLVLGTITQRTRSGGWGTKTHVARVRHRYGPGKYLVHVVSFCGTRGRLEAGALRRTELCGRCERSAERQGIDLDAVLDR